MNPLSKFAVFLVLAGVLAALFAYLPGDRSCVVPTDKIEIQPKESAVRARAVVPETETAGEKSGKVHTTAEKAENKISQNVRVPAIRGITNYGWVELPRGTRVNLVRESGSKLLVRWDGNVVSVPSLAAASGAIVIR
jgi:hypothetical protein